VDGDLVYWNNIQELIKELKLEHTSSQWTLSVYSSKVSMKAVLLHNENKSPSIHRLMHFHMKETKDFLQVLLQKIRYEEYRWKTRSALKVIALLTGLQGG
jgi:hypothetical protein